MHPRSQPRSTNKLAITSSFLEENYLGGYQRHASISANVTAVSITIPVGGAEVPALPALSRPAERIWMRLFPDRGEHRPHVRQTWAPAEGRNEFLGPGYPDRIRAAAPLQLPAYSACIWATVAAYKHANEDIPACLQSRSRGQRLVSVSPRRGTPSRLKNRRFILSRP